MLVSYFGTVFAFGDNKYGQLGDGTTTQLDQPTLIGGLQNIACVSCSENHTLCVDADGNVWSFGLNVMGKLGHSFDSKTVLLPTNIPNLKDIVTAAAGSNFSICVNSKGNLWAFGCNSHGQLGFSDVKKQCIPAEVPFFAQVESVACGFQHTLCKD